MQIVLLSREEKIHLGTYALMLQLAWQRIEVPKVTQKSSLSKLPNTNLEKEPVELDV